MCLGEAGCVTEGEGIGTMQRAVGKQDLEAAVAEDGTECLLENKKGLCVVPGGGQESETTGPWGLGPKSPGMHPSLWAAESWRRENNSLLLMI